MNLLFSSFWPLSTPMTFYRLCIHEINTISACAIVCAKESGETVAAAIRYLIMSLVEAGSSLSPLPFYTARQAISLWNPWQGCQS